MNWTQLTDPLNQIALSAFVAAIPIFFIFWALAIQKMKGYKASLLTVFIAILFAVILYGMPVNLALLSTLHGALYGLFPICWIIIGAVFLYNITVQSGQFEVIKNFMASITPDRRLQGLLIAFSFGAFLEGATGFGAPIAISAAMLVGLGFNPLYAAGICLIANTAPVAFGAVGTPIIMASQVSDIPEMAISQMVGRTLPILSVIIPFYLVILMAGYKKSIEVLPAIIVSGVSFAFFQWFSSNYLGPMLPDVIAGLASIISLMVLLKYWKPKTLWRFSEEPQQTIDTELKYTTGQVVRAWSPFIIMTVMVIAWGLAPVKAALNSMGIIKFAIPGLQDAILKADGSPLVIKPFEFNYLSTPGTALLIAAIISLPFIGLSFKSGAKVYLATLNQLKFPIITIASVVGFAFIANNSGMSNTMAMALASTGVLFPFFSPMLGWLGVFLTGSDTSANALFCKLQYTSAETLGIDPVVTVSANASGGVTGKMISPQSIAIGSAAVGLVGKESDLLRFTVKHSFIMLFVICILTILQAYVITWIIPTYEMMLAATAAASDISKGFMYLLILALVIVTIALVVYVLNRNRSKEEVQTVYSKVE
ncbi:L-lactate permease [Rhodocytophaga rosea]|uniref:L-lactate permease n=1 Tax=Rhodocytophaga rosea TaxID=2704465 RepID=A0A6C0GCK5_9BACT|nr:lactate permease LctP family transporter [Rhodocytophaga rosea]QHT65701.1 L-lactate permease [Rhodocytophaga rosea]